MAIAGVVLAILLFQMLQHPFSSPSPVELAIAPVLILGSIYVYLQQPFGGVVLSVLSWIAVGVGAMMIIGFLMGGGGARQTLLLLAYLVPALVAWIAGGVNLLDYFRDFR